MKSRGAKRDASVQPSGRAAYERLRSLIIIGRLAPGARLVELELAEMLGISRTPVREAMRQLAQEGFARATGPSGRTQLIVSPMTPSDLFDVYTLMGALEGAAVRLLPQLGPDARAHVARDLDATNKAFERIGRQTPRAFDRLFESHNAFHHVLVAACPSERVRHLIEQVRPHVHRYEYLYAAAVGPDYSATFDEHRAIIAAARADRWSAAERAVRLNWFNSADRLLAARASLPSLGAADRPASPRDMPRKGSPHRG